MSKLVLNLDKIKFPAIGFPEGRTLCYSRNENDLTTCNKLALKKGFYKGLQLVDSNGSLYEIIDAQRISTIGPLWGFNIFLNPKLKVDLIIAKEEPVLMPIDKFKEKVINGLRYRDSILDTGGKLVPQIKFVQNATSYEHIITKLCEQYYREY